MTKFFELPLIARDDYILTEHSVSCTHILALCDRNNTCHTLMSAPDCATAEKIATALTVSAIMLETGDHLAHHVDHYRMWIDCEGTVVRQLVMTYG